ncbi:MAG: ABC transporter substrate-binding protein, partial [Planctomyces sp.]
MSLMFEPIFRVLRRGKFLMGGRVLLLLSLVAVLCGCGGAESKTPQLQARLALNWYPEVEHGGFLAADVLGKFAAEEVSVEIIPGGQGAPQAVIAELAAGRIQFAVSDADNV